MNWNEALNLMRTEHRPVRRKNWSGSKYIFLVPSYKTNAASYIDYGYITDESCTVEVVDHILIHTKDNRLGFYATTQCDMLADDWIEYK